MLVMLVYFVHVDETKEKKVSLFSHTSIARWGWWRKWLFFRI